MGSSPSKSRRKEKEAKENNSETFPQMKILQSDILIPDGTENNTNNLDKQDGNSRKNSHPETDEISGRKIRNDNDTNKAVKENSNRRTETKNNSGTLDVGEMRIALPHQSEETLELDERSPNQIIKDEKAKMEAEMAKKRENQRQVYENEEKARKWKLGLEKSLEDKVLSLKIQFDGCIMKLSTLKNAVKMINNFQQKKGCSKCELVAWCSDEELQTKLKSVKQERAKKLHRLSELASARLRYNNPDIADLSDGNRATKLAEKFSELYDNEWTDLFEVTKERVDTKSDDRVTVESLRDILKFCYRICQRTADLQRNNLSCCLNMQPQNVKLASYPDPYPASPEFRLRLKAFQKNLSHLSLPYIQKVAKDGVAEDGVESSEKLFTENVVIKLHSDAYSKYNSYINACTEITWYMQILDPPAVLDFGTRASEPSRFRTYTMSGPQLDYILWPAMLLRENGPVLAKGVAQFRKKDNSIKGMENIDQKRRGASRENNLKYV